MTFVNWEEECAYLLKRYEPLYFKKKKKITHFHYFDTFTIANGNFCYCRVRDKTKTPSKKHRIINVDH